MALHAMHGMHTRTGGISLRRRQAFLIVQSVLCALVAGFLAAGALRLYWDGTARQATGDLFDYIYTREKAGARLMPVLPFFFISLGMTISGLMLGIRDEKAMQCMRDENLLRDLSTLRDRAVHQAAGMKTRALRVIVTALAAVLILAGILNGGLEDVLAKGAVICTECIGLG